MGNVIIDAKMTDRNYEGKVCRITREVNDPNIVNNYKSPLVKVIKTTDNLPTIYIRDFNSHPVRI